MALSLTPSTTVAVVLTTASLFALAGGLGVALRDRRARQTVALRGQLLVIQLRALIKRIETDATRLAESREKLGRLVREAQSTLADHGDQRSIDWPPLSQSDVISDTLTAVGNIADSLNEVARQAKDLPVEVVLYASDIQDALVALVVATDALTSAATELEQADRELAQVTTDSLLHAVTAERTGARQESVRRTVTSTPRVSTDCMIIRSCPDAEDLLFCRTRCRFRELRDGGEPPPCQCMMNFTSPASARSDRPVPFTDQLRLAVAAYLSRFKGSSRDRTESDLRCSSPGVRNVVWTRSPHGVGGT